jgi:microcystin-dependent protein
MITISAGWALCCARLISIRANAALRFIVGTMAETGRIVVMKVEN